MKKKIFFIILGALLILALIFLLWFWFFGRHDKSDVLPNNGSLGTATDSNNVGAGGGGGGNDQSPIGSNAGAGAGAGAGSGGSGSGNVQTPIPDYTYGYTGTTSTYTTYTTTPSGVIWLDGSGGGDGSTNNRFTPTPINQLNNIDLSGIGNIGSTNTGTGGDLGIGGSLIGAAISCIVYLIPAPPTPLDLFQVQVSDNADKSKTVQDCLTRVVAKIAIQSITQSIVEWINSGFNGQPSFVQDYEKFFTDIADRSAGEFIQGSGLAFLCSPFQLQVKIAVAQSYANRKASSASSCTLSGVINNVDGFFKGNFQDGGWPGFLQVTTAPQNNPYGGFVQAQIALNNKVLVDTTNANRNIKDGFIGSTEEYNCRTIKDTDGSISRDCQTRIVTPPSISEGLAQKISGLGIDENLLADSFDEIISALMNQLVSKLLYSGLSNLSSSIDVGQQRGLDAAQTLLTNLQGASQIAQQYGSSQQGSIGDIQAAQAQLTTLANCWSTAASSTSLSSGQIAQAQGNAVTANTTIVNLEARVALFNNNITKANTAMATIAQLQTSALSATTLKEVQVVQKQFTAAQNSGALITQATVTSAQQDRQTLQSEMNGLNQSTAAQLTQCYAFGQ
jgi:hypothetical protein